MSSAPSFYDLGVEAVSLYKVPRVWAVLGLTSYSGGEGDEPFLLRKEFKQVLESVSVVSVGVVEPRD